MNTNSLDLSIDILNIIGDYVKKDNAVIIEKLMKESFKQVDVLIFSFRHAPRREPNSSPRHEGAGPSSTLGGGGLV